MSDYKISDFGIVGDGKTINTDAIPKVIDICNKKGGKVIFERGFYKTGFLSLKAM
ncbi:MAG: hypothetical protein NC915_02645 [Candidatus Omnitrophica bacterium]|nr:hypothetical protein [Candidatus Omnitrophota bacterium]